MAKRPDPGSSVHTESLDSIAAYWRQGEQDLPWCCPFVLPAWLKAWWTSFSGDWKLNLLSVRNRGHLAGVAPLMRRGHQVRLIGDADVCDHLDVVVAPDQGDFFSRRLLDHLAEVGIRQMVLSPVREDSTVMTHFLPVADRWGATIRCTEEENLYALPLPSSWQAYLQQIGGKERHEIRRKLRRLEKAGQIALRCVGEADKVPEAMKAFLTLFKANRKDKAAFMSGPMPAFFTRLASHLAASGLLRLYFIDIDGRPTAAAFCVAHRSTVYLYNNGYDATYGTLSVGLLSKVLSIKESIHGGWKVYDFLKGSEVYKRRLGGRPIGLQRCVVAL